MSDFDTVVEQFRTFCTEEGPWKPAKEADGVKVHTRTIEGSALNVSRGIVTIKAPVEKCFELAMNAEKRTTWDKVTKESRLLKKIDDTHFLTYMQSMAKWPASARDFIIELAVKRFEDKSIVVYGKTPDSDDTPVPKGVVRGKCISSGYIFVPNADDTETTVTFVMQLDMCGSVPNFIVNMVMVDEPLCLAQFRALVEAEAKK